MGNSGTLKALEHLGSGFPSDKCDANVDPVSAFEVSSQQEGARSREGSHTPVTDASLTRQEGIYKGLHLISRHSKQGTQQRELARLCALAQVLGEVDAPHCR